MSTRTFPRKLYKYKCFGVESLSLLSNEEVYYVDPRSFNDPLDCDPTIQIDTDRASIEKLCYRMFAALHGKQKALKEIGNQRYSSTEYGDYKTDPEVEKYYMRQLGSLIKRLLDTEMASSGVLSLAERWDCPLMWSHYADKHRGLCIEYDLTENHCPHIKPVNWVCRRSDVLSHWRNNAMKRFQGRIPLVNTFGKASLHPVDGTPS